jgi:anionic cell wall polymer biosynthesis LytR-Cps2A-Psr (LCP) family protein
VNDDEGLTPSAPGSSDDVVPAGGAGAPSVAAATTDGGRAARRRALEEASREQSHQSHRRVLVMSGAILGLVAVAVLIWFVFLRGGTSSDATPQPTPSGTGPTQPTLLFQVTDSDGIAVDNGLLSVGGPQDRGNLITIPPTTIVDVATGGTLPFGEIARLPDPDGSADALSDAIGVVVDATVAMDTLAFSGLVDAVGGITADVDVDVVQEQPDGTQLVLVPAGDNSQLTGPQAAAYATYLATGEPEEARMARFSQVLRLTVAALPDDVTKIEAILTGLGTSVETTVPLEQVSQFLLRLRDDVRSDEVVYKSLPVKPIDTGGPTAYRIDQEAAAVMVQELFPDAVRTPGPNAKVRVLVQNGVGSPGLNAAARQLLVDAGFTYVNGGNAEAFGVAETAIVVPDSSSESLQWGADIATALGVPTSAVQVATTGQSVADVIVVLGADFVPTS